MATGIGRLTASAALEAELDAPISVATGLSRRRVVNRLKYARGNTLVRNVFVKYWPYDGSRLCKLTVAFARDVGLHEELMEAAQLSERTVMKRLEEATGNKLLANAFPEMMADISEDSGTEEDGEEEDGEEDQYGSDPEEINVDLSQRRVASVRDDEEAIQQLVNRLGISKKSIQRRLRDAHGKKLIGNLFANRRLLLAPVETGATVTNTVEVIGNWNKIHGLVAKRWKIIRELGEGGFGTAYEVHDEKFPDHGPAVLKFAKGTASADRLRKEIGFAIDLQHQNICAYRHIDEDENYGTFIILQHGGTSLEKLIKNRGAFEAAYALEIIRQAAEGIDYAHEREVLHQDIKPGNILVSERRPGRVDVRISDFGISLRGRETELIGGGRTIVATMAFGFSRAFASPEQISGRQVSRKSDQYSLALVFCAMLEGDVFDSPYSRRTFGRLSSKQNAALERALRRDPSERYPSCRALAAALGAV